MGPTVLTLAWQRARIWLWMGGSKGGSLLGFFNRLAFRTAKNENRRVDQEPSHSQVCPRCGQLLVSPEQPHLCQSLESQSEASPAGEDLFSLDQIQQQPRIAPCPQCGCDLDVTACNPLDTLECSSCHASFSLMLDFADYQILKRIGGEWQNRLYWSLHSQTADFALLIVMSSEVFGSQDRENIFSIEAATLYSRLNVDWIQGVSLEQYRGFVYLAISFKQGTSEEVVLSALGLATACNIPVQNLAEGRTTSCPSCRMAIDSSGLDPLDQAVCPNCGKSFKVCHNFGQYRLDYRLNSGGTSILYLARNVKSGKKVALKILSTEEMARNLDSVASFVREFELTQSLKHPNIIGVYEGGQHEGYHYICMELVEGLTLDEILFQIQQKERQSTAPDSNVGINQYRAGFPELVSLEIMLQAAAGLGVAHQRGLIHGDVKPENIMLTQEGVVKVLDFGLVQFANAEKLFAEGEADTIYGTPLYIPPERVRGESEDFRSDIYALGATLYHMLRGIAPFRAKSPSEIAIMHAQAPVIKFNSFVSSASETTCRIVEKSLKKIVSERYGSHIEFIADLTLAKRLLLQRMGRSKQGQALLKAFMRQFHVRKKANMWERATTSVVYTYRYATMAITARFRKSAAR